MLAFSRRASRIEGSLARWGVLVCLGLILGLARHAAADGGDAGTAPASDLVPKLAPKVSYEQHRTDLALRQEALVVEPVPEGKRIAFVRVVRDDVFVKEEIWPLWLNWFHGRTRDYVVRRELLFAEGSVYEVARIEETMRNLRGMGIFALVRIVAVQGAKPGEVGVLVYTRDLWSLRLETDFNIAGDVVNKLVLRGTERNMFGHNKAVGVDFTLLPQSYWINQDYTARRVFNTSWMFQERGGPIFRRASNQIEGEYAALVLGQPYYRLSQRFAWRASASHLRYVQRNTANGDVKLFPSSYYDKDGPFAQQVYRQRSEAASLLGYFRHGERVKHTFALGWDYRSKKVNPIAETELPVEREEEFEFYVMPRQRTDNGPYLAYDFFVPRWATFVNLATYGQSENVRVGPSGTFVTRVPIGPLGSTSTAWVLAGDVGLTLAPHGFLLDMKVGGNARLGQGHWVDQLATFMVRGSTPVFWALRFVSRAYLELRKRDTQRTYVSLGADNGLRGYTSQAINGVGADRFLANFELRTLPIEWEALHVGGVVFYDVGSVFTQNQPVNVYHSVGVGLRILFPQLNRTPFSLDGGLSFDPETQFVPSFSSGQAIPLTAAEDPT